jgi:hypothetical protein
LRPGEGTARALASLRGRHRSWEKQVGPAQGSRIRTAGKRANAKWGPASLPTPCRRTSIRLASPKKYPRPLVSAACSTHAANGIRLRILVTGVGRDTLSGLNAATSGGQLDHQAETRQSRFGHYLRTTFHPLPGSAHPVFTATPFPIAGIGKDAWTIFPCRSTKPLLAQRRAFLLGPTLPQLHERFPCGTFPRSWYKWLMSLRFLASSSAAYSHDAVIESESCKGSNDISRLWITWISWRRIRRSCSPAPR